MTLLNLVPPERANVHQMTAILTLSTDMFLTFACGLSVAGMAAVA
jgi:hypothetical protein